MSTETEILILNTDIHSGPSCLLQNEESNSQH